MDHHFREHENHACISRRVLLGAAVAGGASLAAGETVAHPSPIEAMFHEWLAIRMKDYSGFDEEDEALDALTNRYFELAALIFNARASTEREFAMQYCAATDHGESVPNESFQKRMLSLLG